jgi:Holliday junction resolvase
VRRAAKRDTSEKPIVDALRLCGWTVSHISEPDLPDLVAGKNQRTYLIEVKTGKKKLRPGQAKWAAEWRGADVVILRSVDDALRFEQTYGRETKCG